MSHNEGEKDEQARKEEEKVNEQERKKAEKAIWEKRTTVGLKWGFYKRQNFGQDAEKALTAKKAVGDKLGTDVQELGELERAYKEKYPNNPIVDFRC